MDPEHNPNPQLPSSIKINIDNLQTQFQCTVCLNPINDAYITRCGHVFCKLCIQQTINRHHRCPFCNQQLKQFKADVFKNYHFNTIKKIVEDQKKIQIGKYLGKVFATDLNKKIQVENAEIQELLRPVQKKIVQNCQNSLLQYRKFLINLYSLQKQSQQKKALHGSQQIRDHSTIIKSLHQFIINNIPNPIISPQIIQKPTQIHIVLPGNKINKNTLKIAPMTTFQTLLPYIDKICSQNNLQLKGKISDILTINGIQHSIKDRIGLLSGSLIKIQKGIPFVQKIYCFTYNWDKNKIGIFYNCKSCNVKWICQNCILYCHTGHTYQLQIKQHKADWAMCYCVSKCQCLAINKNNMSQ